MWRPSSTPASASSSLSCSKTRPTTSSASRRSFTTRRRKAVLWPAARRPVAACRTAGVDRRGGTRNRPVDPLKPNSSKPNQSPTKPNQGNGLGFSWISWSDSGLFSGLRGIQMKKIPSWAGLPPRPPEGLRSGASSLRSTRRGSGGRRPASALGLPPAGRPPRQGRDRGGGFGQVRRTRAFRWA